ncbi:MAG: ThiF family adenylyltransferase [Betaproteobacteria bacterium]|nr:ThiF family adenylyltransferase [Betaproteobacteria bacterium]
MSARYHRHTLIDGFSQERLAATRLAVVGAGAIGNEAVKNLVLLGVGHIDLHDFDRAEIHNLTRSIFLRESDVGTEKAVAVAQRAAEVDPNVTVTPLCGDVWDTLTLARLEACDALVCCVDNFETRLRLNQLCLIAGVDLINAAIDSRHATVEVFPLSQPGAACYECHLPESAYARMARRYSCGGLRRLAWRENIVPTTAITASMAGALAASAALRLGEGPSATGRRIFCDTRAGTTTVAALARRETCVACSAFSRPALRLPAANRWDSPLRDLAGALDGDIAVRLSDPIITGYRCARCGPPPDAAQVMLVRARDFDERIARCGACGQPTVRVDIRDRFRLSELMELFGERPLPARHVLAHIGGDMVCIDLLAAGEAGDARAAPPSTREDAP